MKILTNKINHGVSIGKLSYGDVFEFKEHYYIKADAGKYDNAVVNLLTGEITNMYDDTLVERVECKLVVEK